MIPLAQSTADLVRSALDDLKRRNAGRRPFTNYFLNDLSMAANLRVVESERTLCVTHDEWDFSRLYFQTYDPADLEQTLRGLSWAPLAVADWITKGSPSPIDSVLTSVGFHLHAVYDRIVCREFRQESPSARLFFASYGDRQAIHALLFQVFDKYADHIFDIDTLDRLIEANQVLTTLDEAGAINGLVVLPITDNVCNFNFLYNRGGAQNLVRLLQDFYGTLTERNVSSGISWVRRTRPSVLRLHQSFGWRLDGLVDYIYMR
jgi:hypothetical protein